MSADRARGEIVRLWTKRGKNIPLDAHDKVTLVAGQGIDGDANPRGGKRQVMLIAEEDFQAGSSGRGGTLDQCQTISQHETQASRA